ncbi:MAG: Pyridoxal phosphate homeostasis protein [Acidimicrobiales bacterium]|nr:Pyridoxal phosphate homeostasis protein [Acidimicrobiales bacterium]
MTNADLVERLTERRLALEKRVHSLGGEGVAIVAVTKGRGLDVVEAARAAGFGDLGENYAQELRSKARALKDLGPDGTGPGPEPQPVAWHFLGRLQRNKVRLISEHVSLWQSIDRTAVIEELGRRSPGAAVLIQLNLSGEPQKGGCSFSEAPALVERAAALGLQVDGLMGVAAAGAGGQARAGFRSLVRLADELDLPVRSIGMSDDLEIALEEGSTMVRVGSALFGPRPQATRR